MPTASATSRLNNGWNLDFRGGYNVTRNFLADIDFSYNQWGLTDTALAAFGEPNGHANVWSLTFTPVIKLAPARSPVNFYVLAGTGVYHRGLQVSHPSSVDTIYCDPFFGYCYPAVVSVDQVVASLSTYKLGYQAGGGVEFRIGHGGLKAFAEARYNQMFTTHGKDLTFVPVTFGIRW
jgi:opacity protein-like surface antigen